MKYLYLSVAIGGSWFVGLMHGYTSGTNDFVPHGEAICTCVELGCIALAVWVIGKQIKAE